MEASQCDTCHMASSNHKAWRNHTLSAYWSCSHHNQSTWASKTTMYYIAKFEIEDQSNAHPQTATEAVEYRLL